MSKPEPEPTPLPPYSYVPGGPWPHPTSSPLGHRHGKPAERPPPIKGDSWEDSPMYLQGARLFNAGYYWEAHEAWESLWHAHHRQGPTAEVLKGLIKLAAAGVKIRERRDGGARSLARRAADHFAGVLAQHGDHRLGLDLTQWIKHAESIAHDPPIDPGTPESPAHSVFSFQITPESKQP